jgi:hypothetical protein
MVRRLRLAPGEAMHCPRPLYPKPSFKFASSPAAFMWNFSNSRESHRVLGFLTN